MNTERTYRLGGKDRTLLFGKPGFLRYVQDITKQDPFAWFNSLVPKEGEERRATVQNIDDAAIFVYAGLNTYLDDNDQDNFSLDKVSKWTNGLDFDCIAEIVKVSIEAFFPQNGEVKGEEEKKTEVQHLLTT